MAFPHPDGLAAAKAAQIRGFCAFCEEPLLKGCTVVCREPGCRTAYLRAWHRDAQVMHPHRYARSPKYLAMHVAWTTAKERRGSVTDSQRSVTNGA